MDTFLLVFMSCSLHTYTPSYRMGAFLLVFYTGYSYPPYASYVGHMDGISAGVEELRTRVRTMYWVNISNTLTDERKPVAHSFTLVDQNLCPATPPGLAYDRLAYPSSRSATFRLVVATGALGVFVHHRERAAARRSLVTVVFCRVNDMYREVPGSPLENGTD